MAQAGLEAYNGQHRIVLQGAAELGLGTLVDLHLPQAGNGLHYNIS